MRDWLQRVRGEVNYETGVSPLTGEVEARRIVAVLWLDEQMSWQPREIGGAAVGLGMRSGRLVVMAASESEVVLTPVQAGRTGWLLMCARGQFVRVNGDVPLTGVQALRDRDVISAGERTCVFSSESLPVVAAFPQSQPVPCARCKTAIKPGSPAVQCPRCHAWHHAQAELSCWAYAEKCAACEQPTVMDGQYRWSPEGL